jgi:hypothetical protein
MGIYACGKNSPLRPFLAPAGRDPQRAQLWLDGVETEVPNARDFRVVRRSALIKEQPEAERR